MQFYYNETTKLYEFEWEEFYHVFHNQFFEYDE